MEDVKVTEIARRGRTKSRSVSVDSHAILVKHGKEVRRRIASTCVEKVLTAPRGVFTEVLVYCPSSYDLRLRIRPESAEKLVSSIASVSNISPESVSLAEIRKAFSSVARPSSIEEKQRKRKRKKRLGDAQADTAKVEAARRPLAPGLEEIEVAEAYLRSEEELFALEAVDGCNVVLTDRALYHIAEKDSHRGQRIAYRRIKAVLLDGNAFKVVLVGKPRGSLSFDAGGGESATAELRGNLMRAYAAATRRALPVITSELATRSKRAATLPAPPAPLRLVHEHEGSFHTIGLVQRKSTTCAYCGLHVEQSAGGYKRRGDLIYHSPECDPFERLRGPKHVREPSVVEEEPPPTQPPQQQKDGLGSGEAKSKPRRLCAGCGLVFEKGEYVELPGGLLFHKGCFKCTVCEARFTEQTGYFRSKKGMPVCAKHKGVHPLFRWLRGVKNDHGGRCSGEGKRCASEESAENDPEAANKPTAKKEWAKKSHGRAGRQRAATEICRPCHRV